MNLPVKLTQFITPLIVGLLCIVLWLFDPYAQSVLAFNRLQLEQGHIWQLLSANLVHNNSWHLALNMAGLALLWSIHGYAYRATEIILLIIVCSLSVTLGIYLFSPSLIIYTGLSGVLHGLFVWGAFKDIENGVSFGWLLMLGVWLKILYEQTISQNQFIAGLIETHVATESHLFGACAGLVLVLIQWMKQKRRHS